MSKVTIRDLRNHGADVIARVSRGEKLTITCAGKAVAQLQPVDRAPLPAEALVARWKHLPTLDGDALRADIDTVVDSAL
jgi:prevent-host-death family protein